MVAELHQSVQEEADATAEFLTTIFTQVGRSFCRLSGFSLTCQGAQSGSGMEPPLSTPADLAAPRSSCRMQYGFPSSCTPGMA